MDQYSALVFFHVASVIVWLGAGTTVALLALYAQRSSDAVVLERLGDLVRWLAPRVLAPSALAALGFGIAAAHSGHWPRFFWFHVGEAAFAVSFVITVAFRVPLLRRVRRGAVNSARFARLTAALALAELTVLYLAVAAMVAKPSSSDTGTIAVGGGIATAAFLISIAIGFSGSDRRAAPVPSTDSR